MAKPFEIFTSLRYDPVLPSAIGANALQSYPDMPVTPYYLLQYHQDRLLSAAQCFNWEKAVEFLTQDLTQFIEFLDSFIPDKMRPWRLRIVIDSSGAATVNAIPTLPIATAYLLVPVTSGISSDIWRVYVDSERTMTSVLNTHKTTARDDYTAARLRSGLISTQEPAEVLLVNLKGEVMEGSITTAYFRCRPSLTENSKISGAEWATPPLCSGCNAGTTRRYALAQGFCFEQVIKADDLRDGEECWLSNGVRGFIRGIVVVRNSD